MGIDTNNINMKTVLFFAFISVLVCQSLGGLIDDPTTEPNPEPTTSPQPDPSPEPTTEPEPTPNSFDALSFVGGMLLAVGLAGLGFLGWFIYTKCSSPDGYQRQTN